MDKLKDFIDKNREAFDDESLPEGHLERFMQKLPAEPKKKKIPLYTVWGAFLAAAVATLFLLLRTPDNVPSLSPRPDPTQMLVCPAKQEFEELRLYYHMQMNEVIFRIRTLSKNDHIPGGADVLQEIKKVLTDNSRFEELILPTLPCSNDGLFAATQHYSNSLESLTIMLEQMEQTKNP